MSTLLEWEAYSAWTTSIWQMKDDDEKSKVIEALGLAGEAGEVVDRLKKMFRAGSKDRSPEEQLICLREELGDMFYYAARIMRRHGITLDDVLANNIKKLEKRYGYTA